MMKIMLYIPLELEGLLILEPNYSPFSGTPKRPSGIRMVAVFRWIHRYRKVASLGDFCSDLTLK